MGGGISFPDGELRRWLTALTKMIDDAEKKCSKKGKAWKS